MEKFAQKKPTCIAYDEKLQFYSNLVIEVRNVIICLFLCYCSFNMSATICLVYAVVNLSLRKPNNISSTRKPGVLHVFDCCYFSTSTFKTVSSTDLKLEPKLCNLKV